jgi:uncharacterized coiled-coil protein SlyX
MPYLRCCFFMIAALWAALACAQQVPAAAPVVPRLIRFTGTFHPAAGPPAGPLGATFSVYSQQEGGTPLWTEDQNVELDANGAYTVLLGSTKNSGLPVELFSAGDARWLQVQFYTPGEVVLPRVLLVSVPYALKAGDAETLGGKPASAYLLAPAAPDASSDGPSGAPPPASAPQAAAARPHAATPAANSGSPGYLSLFTNTTDVGDSVMFQRQSLLGAGTTMPLISLDVRTTTVPQIGVAGTTDYLALFASDMFGPGFYWDPAKDLRMGVGGPLLYNKGAFVEYMRIQSTTGNVGIGTSTPAARLEVNGNAQVDGNLTLSGSLLSPVNSTPVIQAPANATNNFGAGLGALSPASTGTQDTAVGDYALYANATGASNTAVGASALQNNTTGSFNTAIGTGALFKNITSPYNTAVGYNALLNNTTSIGDNTAVGFSALSENTTGAANVAMGFATLKSNTTGNRNTSIGLGGQNGTTTGSDNTALGYQALSRNTTGNYNTALGEQALFSSTGSSNVGVGYFAGWNLTTGNNNVDIANQGATSDSGVIRIGSPASQTATFIAGIRGTRTGNDNAVPVVIDSNGQLGTVSSSRRFKEDIQDMGAASSGLMRLRPVTFRYRQPFSDGSKPLQYGLIAEEVAQVYPNLVARSADGQIETVKYQVLNCMLLNELQKQNATIAAQKDALASQQASLAAQQKEIRSLTERLARVEALLEATPATSAASQTR